MLEFLFHLSDFDLFTLLSFAFIATSIFGVIIIGWIVPIHVRYKDDTVIGNVSSLISLLYGLLAGITALYLMNNINYASDATHREVNAASNIIRASQWLQEPARTDVRRIMRNYAQTVINVEWPLMNSGKPLNLEGDGNINNLSRLFYTYNTNGSPQQTLLVTELAGALKQLFDARQDRIHASYSELSSELWMVLILGTVLTIGINFLFGMNRYLHIVVMAATSLMVTAMLFLLITLDRPFQGDTGIGSEGYQELVALIDREAARDVHPSSPTPAR